MSRPIGTDVVFAGLWAIIFLLYLPAAKAGFVADFTGWLDQTIHYGFWDNINRTHYRVQSLYQFTQLNTWLFYQVAGTNAWAWHLLFITLHALNGALLYRLGLRLLADSAITGASPIALSGAVLFCITPSAAEVVVWEPSFHYLQGLLLILLILNWTHRYIHTFQPRYAVMAGVAFFLSTFSLEIFYITPWLALCMGAFYHFNDSFDECVLRRVITTIFLPQLLLFLLHLLLFRLYYGSWLAHIGPGAVNTALQEGLGKPAKHLFHILLLGRFFSDGVRHSVYHFLDSWPGIVLCYLAVAASLTYIFRRFAGMKGKARVLSLMFLWTLITLALLIPLWFGNSMLIIYDRYTYFTNAFVFMCLSIAVSLIPAFAIRAGLLGVYALINIRFTIQLSRYWMKSEKIIGSLLRTFPYDADKKIILLNLPQTMHGAAMIGAEQPSEYKMMHNGLQPARAIHTTVYDAMAYNMITPSDGAHVTVLNDSTIQVTLNQWGTWWWYEMQGGHSYSNADYTINMKDPGHVYELTLRQPAAQFLLLYQAGDQWKTVDMSRRNTDQY